MNADTVVGAVFVAVPALAALVAGVAIALEAYRARR